MATIVQCFECPLSAGRCIYIMRAGCRDKGCDETTTAAATTKTNETNKKLATDVLHISYMTGETF